jgi:Sigma-70 region 2
MVTAELVARARAGDGEAFRELTEPHRRELLVHCYRMLGSVQDAEDALQDTLLAAWQGLPGFEGRASLRTWPYRIATNRCLSARRSASRRPAKEWDVPGVAPPEPTRLGEVVWLQPFPDALLEARPRCRSARGPLRAGRSGLPGVRDRPAGPPRPPGCRAGLARRPRLPRQRGGRGARLDRLVGQRRLKRARASLQRRRPPAAEGEPPPAADSPAEQAVVARFVRAWESADLEALVALLTDDVLSSMPPVPLEYQGREVVARLCASIIFGAGRRFDLVPTRANGQPAFGPTCAPRTGVRHGVGLFVLTLSGDRVCAMTRFDDGVLGWFGLPRSLPSR